MEQSNVNIENSNDSNKSPMIGDYEMLPAPSKFENQNSDQILTPPDEVEDYDIAADYVAVEFILLEKSNEPAYSDATTLSKLL